LDTQKLKRNVLKILLSPLLHWRPLVDPHEGFSIVLGVPWALRHLLPVNLQFVERTDTTSLHRIHIVFDRSEQEGGTAFITRIQEDFPALPLTFRFHPLLAGQFVEMINQSKFYASMNWIIGLSQCETRYAIMHDFDLYPLAPNYFSSMYEALRDRQLRFTGLEWTGFDGLDPSHALIGTWALGIDVAWLRENYQPIDCFHNVESISGRRFDLDAFSSIQSHTLERQLVGTVTDKDMAHVRNLCSTYLRFTKGEHFDVVWRLHNMWYLETLRSGIGRLHELTQLMNNATSSRLHVDNHFAEFGDTHVTCANVLRNEILPMEIFLYGKPRPEVLTYIDAFERFLWQHGSSPPILNSDGTIRWSPESATHPAAPLAANQTP